MDAPFKSLIAEHIWKTKYRYRSEDGGDRGIEDTWRRVAEAIAGEESTDRAHWANSFYAIMEDFSFLPAGRILVSAGTPRQATMCSCFVMGRIVDTLDGVIDGLREGALTMQAGGGVGYDFSTLRPRGFDAGDSTAPGPVAFMRVWDAMCATLLTVGERRGAMMATLRCDHPDIEAFIGAKRTPGELARFNCSVLVTDAFIEAVDRDEPWQLVFPDESGSGETVERRWTDGRRTGCRVVRTVDARTLWQSLLESAYATGDPGVIFIDRMNALNNLAYAEHILTTNPCGEVPLPEYGACNLGSFNLTRFVRNPFSSRAQFDLDELAARVPVAVRFLDNVIDATHYPLERQSEVAKRSRRIGIGFTGLADALVMLGLHYADDAACAQAGAIMRCIRDAAYTASAELATERSSYPAFDAERFLVSECGRRLPPDLRRAIGRKGMRNSHLTSIAPAGTISLLANNVSSGIEPIYATRMLRSIRDGGDVEHRHEVEDHAYRLWRQTSQGESLPDAFVDAFDLAPAAHLRMQAAVQPYVDSAIAKTINVAPDCPFEEFAGLFRSAFELGLKGCTVFRAGPDAGGVLNRHCGTIA